MSPPTARAHAHNPGACALMSDLPHHSLGPKRAATQKTIIDVQTSESMIGIVVLKPAYLWFQPNRNRHIDKRSLERILSLF